MIIIVTIRNHKLIYDIFNEYIILQTWKVMKI